MDFQAMKDYIKSFSLDTCAHGNQGYSRVLLQLFGYTGHGRSSFINSCKYVMDDGPYKIYAKVAGSDYKPETMIRNAYELTNTVTLVDNRGCAKMDKNEIGAIYAQLGNFLPLDSEVKWQTGFKDMLDILLNAERQEQSMDLIVSVLVWSAKVQIVPEQVDEMKEILLKTRDITGLFPTVVITNKLSEHLSDTQEKFKKMGVENIFPVENYREQDHLKIRGKREGMLKCLYEIIRDVEFRMRETQDPRKEKIERKRILYQFAHNGGLTRREEVERLWREERKNRERAMREEMERLRAMMEDGREIRWFTFFSPHARRRRQMEQTDIMDEVESLLRDMMEKWLSLEDKFPFE